MAHYHHARKVFQHQADATLSQANPGDGTKYTVLDTTKNVRIISITAVCTWTVQPTPLEIHITIDGQAIIHTQTDPVSVQPYGAVRASELAENAQIFVALPANRQYDDKVFLLEGRTVKVEAEITGGTVSNLSARVKYAKIP